MNNRKTEWMCNLPQREIDRIYHAQQKIYWEADFVNRCIDRRLASIGLCNLPYESLSEETEILDTAYKLYCEMENPDKAYSTTLDEIIDRLEESIASGKMKTSPLLKDRIKFCNVDLLSFMERVVQKHTKYYQSDFEIDKEMLWKSMEQEEAQGQTFLWMCRTAGTWLLPERNVLLKGTSENNSFNFYIEQTDDVVLVFAVRVTNVIKGSLIGNVYVLDYSKHYVHVGDIALHPETVLLQYEHASCIKKADFAVKYHVDPEYGKLLSVRYQPHSEEELEKLLQKEQQMRDKFQEGDASTYLEKFEC